MQTNYMQWHVNDKKLDFYGCGTGTGTATFTSRLISTGNGFEYGTLIGTGI